MATLESARSKYVSDAVHTMSPGRMIVALYDRVVLDLERAAAGITAKDIYAAHTALIHAQQILGELLNALDVKQWSGGANLAAHAFKAGLVDECHLFVAPVFLGAGKAALPTDMRSDLELIDERRFSSGVLYLRYRVAS